MDSHKCVIVLTPNGRRQTVKVTPNTTLLQVLEQVCSKHEFNPHEFDLRHHSKRMDVNNVLRFTGLPNNAFLEMIPAAVTRKDNEVVLGVQIESGERFTGTFMPSNTIWSVLEKMCPAELLKEGNPVVIYMRAEISGQESLESTNLRSLGITGGRAMLRFLHRSPESLRTQANVSAPLPRPASKHKHDALNEDKNEESGTKEKLNIVSKEKIVEKELSPESKGNDRNIRDSSPGGEKSRFPPLPKSQKKEISEPKAMDEEAVQPPGRQRIEEATFGGLQGNMLETSVPDECEPMDTTDAKKGIHLAGKVEQGPEEEEEIKLLPGERSGCVFSMNQPSSCAMNVIQDLPDEFFDVTVEDARILLRDLKKRRAELEDAPLLTSAARSEEEVQFLVMPCVVRVMFPDRIVLQGCFMGGEAVNDIKGFVRENLEDSSHPFHLYLSPPKMVLKTECALYKVDGFPTTLLYFAFDRNESSADSTGAADRKYLKSDVLSNLISQKSATKVAQKARGILYRNQKTIPHHAPCNSTTDTSAQPSTSRGTMDYEAPPRSCDSSRKHVPKTSSENVPKWFRSSK